MKSKPSFNWATVSRIVAALLGGYLFTYAFTAALAQLLNIEPKDALVVATLPAFVIYPLVIMWVFACSKLKVVWTGLGLSMPLLIIGFWPQLMRALA